MPFIVYMVFLIMQSTFIFLEMLIVDVSTHFWRITAKIPQKPSRKSISHWILNGRNSWLVPAFIFHVFSAALESVWKAWWLELTPKTKITVLFCHSFLRTWQMSMSETVL